MIKNLLIFAICASFIFLDIWASWFFIRGENPILFLFPTAQNNTSKQSESLEKKLESLQKVTPTVFKSRIKLTGKSTRGLVPEGVYGITSSESNGVVTYGVVGWVSGIDSKDNSLIIYLSSKNFVTKLISGGPVDEVYNDDKSSLKIEPRNFEDIIPNKTRISGTCTDKSCSQLTKISIIDRDENK